MKCFLGISNFLEEISGLSHSVVFLYFFALIAEEGFLISPCYTLEFCIQMVTMVYSLVTQAVKNLPAMQKSLVQSLGLEDPLEKGTSTHSNILAWRNPWTV